MQIPEFQAIIWRYYRKNARSMPWRDEPTLYHVLVSEIMLQQTQVDRVREKYAQFLARFPDVETLAGATLADVLVTWQGLGYNRRAKFLHEAAKIIARDGAPRSQAALMALPGVGKNTAGAIMNYVYEQPTPFIETNIRTVYFHHFYPDGEVISDMALERIVIETMDREYPREWFWALMDYGTWLKKQAGGRLKQSRHYKKQAPLKGSVRELRGELLRMLAARACPEAKLRERFSTDARFVRAFTGLQRDGLVNVTDGVAHLTK